VGAQEALSNRTVGKAVDQRNRSIPDRDGGDYPNHLVRFDILKVQSAANFFQEHFEYPIGLTFWGGATYTIFASR
jgi:hypothetical protein